MRGTSDDTAPPGVFFVHVMKTGGNSVYFALLRAYAGRGLYPDADEGDGMNEKVLVGRLLALDRARRDSVQLFAPHMPAWVADAVAPGHLTTTVLREPVSRTLSHLQLIARKRQFPDDIEEIWADPEWRGHLVDYQTQLFSERPPTEPDLEIDVSGLSEGDKIALHHGVLRTYATANGRPRAVGPADLDVALDMLDGIDVVGVTEDIDDLVLRLGERLGVDLPTPGRRNVTRGGVEPSADLVASIEAHTRLDRVLHQRAVELATAAPTARTARSAVTGDRAG